MQEQVVRKSGKSKWLELVDTYRTRSTKSACDSNWSARRRDAIYRVLNGQSWLYLQSKEHQELTTFQLQLISKKFNESQNATGWNEKFKSENSGLFCVGFNHWWWPPLIKTGRWAQSKRAEFVVSLFSRNGLRLCSATVFIEKYVVGASNLN